MMKLYFRPGSCAMAPLVVLEDLGIDYEGITVDDDTLYSEDYKAVNPRNQVPSLINDAGDIMTESVAIMIWLTNKYGGDLTPAPDSWEYGRMVMCLNFMASQEHPAFGLYLRPFRFHEDEAVQADLKERGRTNWHLAMERTNGWAEGRDWLAGDKMSLADILAWVHARWGLRAQPKTNEAYPALWALAKRVEERDSVKRAVAKCGLDLLSD